MAEEDEVKDMAENEVEDTDADTKDVLQQQSQDYSMVLEELKAIRAENAAIKGQLNSITAQRSVTIESGAVIQDFSEPEPIDQLTPYSELDFSIRK